MEYFTDTMSLAELRARYKALYRTYAPEFNEHGDKEYHEAMIAGIQVAFELHYRLEQERLKTIDYDKIAAPIINLPDIVVEKVGDFIWISGDTKQHHKVLNENGFKFHGKEKMWYYNPYGGTLDNRSYQYRLAKNSFETQRMN